MIKIPRAWKGEVGMKRQHPIAILRYVSGNFWLLLLPLVRGLLALRFDFYSWLSGAYLDILVVLAIFGAAFFRWWNINFRVSKKGIFVRNGFFISEKMKIPFSAFSAVTVNKPFLLRPLKAYTVLIDTDSSSTVNKKEDPDIKLIMREKDVQKLLTYFCPKEEEKPVSYNSNKRRLLFFSLTFSSALSGLIYFGTFLIQGGRLVGNELEERFLGAVNNVTKIAEKVIYGITPATVGIIIVIAFGWGYSFLSNYLKHMNFRLEKIGEKIRIENGFFTKRTCVISSDRVNYADLRQNLLMKICKVMSVNVSCSGYGKKKNEIPVFVPITKKNNASDVMKRFLPDFNAEKGYACGALPSYVMKFLGPPTALIFVIIFVFLGAIMLLPEWYSVILFIAVMGEIVAMHLLIVNLAAFLSNGTEVADECIIIQYCKAFGFHNVIVPLNKISEIRISQNLFQKLNGSCSFILYTRGERAVRHKVKGLTLVDAEKTAELLGYTSN